MDTRNDYKIFGEPPSWRKSNKHTDLSEIRIFPDSLGTARFFPKSSELQHSLPPFFIFAKRVEHLRGRKTKTYKPDVTSSNHRDSQKNMKTVYKTGEKR
jgi:hypothetical protein